MGVLRAASMAAAQSPSPLALSAEDVARLCPLVFGQKVERRLWLRASILAFASALSITTSSGSTSLPTTVGSPHLTKAS